MARKEGSGPKRALEEQGPEFRARDRHKRVTVTGVTEFTLFLSFWFSL